MMESFGVIFWHLKNAEQHVCRFWPRPNVLLKGLKGTASIHRTDAVPLSPLTAAPDDAKSPINEPPRKL